MTNDVERFERRSSTYENSWIQRYLDGIHKLMVETVASEHSGLNPKFILDVGCGTGRLLRRAAAVWPDAQMVGVDAAAGMIESAGKLAPTITFYRGVAEALPLADATVDLVFSALSLHHWEDAQTGVGEVQRVLRRQGLFCLADISMPGWLAKVFRSKARSGSAIRDLLIKAQLEAKGQRRSAGILLVSLAVKTCN
jgi:ubiquinone/menaquinone biosynthesis C-methylase UbiE